MMQDPQGRPSQGPAPVAPPRLPSLQVPPIGPDSPPALGLIQDPAAAPPPVMPPWEPPPVMPEDYGELEQVLMRGEQQIRNMIEVGDYQNDLDITNSVAQAPMVGEQLKQRMLLEPDADYEGELSTLEPFLPKSEAQQIRASRDAYHKYKGKRESFRKGFEETLRTKQPGDVRRDQSKDNYPKDSEVAGAMVDVLREGLGGAGVLPGNGNLLQELQREGLQRVGRHPSGVAGMRDIGRGLTGLLTNEVTVENEMHGRLMTAVDEAAPKLHAGDPFEGERFWATMQGRADMYPKPNTEAEIQVRDAERNALIDEGRRVIHRLKGDTSGRDILSGAAAVLPWAATGVGEIAFGRAVAKAVLPVIVRAGIKIGDDIISKSIRAAITYGGVPAVAEAAIASQQPLPPTWKAEVESTQDPKKREAMEGAYRWLQVSQAAATSVLFSFSDVLRGARGLEHVRAGPARQALEITGMGLAGPAVVEGTNWLVAEAAKKAATGDVTTADTIAQLHASGALGEPIRAMLKAKDKDEFWQAVGEYAQQATPLMAGMTTVHVGAALGARFRSRGQMLEVNRQVARDVDAQVEAGELDQAVADQIKVEARKLTEVMAPTHAEDERRANQETIEDEHGEAAETVVSSHELAKELLPDVPGETVAEKASAAEQALAADPTNEELQRQAEVARRLAGAARSTDPHEAALEQASAEGVAIRKKPKPPREPSREREDPKPQRPPRLRDDDTPPPSGGGAVRPVDVGAEDANLRRNIALEENPAARDKALGEVAADTAREWQVVGRDEDAGTVTLRATDDVSRTVSVRDEDLPNFRLQERETTEAEGDQALREIREEDLPGILEQERGQVARDEEALRRSEADTDLPAEMAPRIRERLRIRREGLAKIEREIERRKTQRVRVDVPEPKQLPEPKQSDMDALLQAEEQARAKIGEAKKQVDAAAKKLVKKDSKKAREDLAVAKQALERAQKNAKLAKRQVNKAKFAARKRTGPKGRGQSLLTRIREIGGISYESWKKTFPGETKGEFRLKGVFRGEGQGGMAWDELASALSSEGYGPSEYHPGVERGESNYSADWLVDALAGDADNMFSELQGRGGDAARKRLEDEAAQHLARERPTEPEAQPERVVDDRYGEAEIMVRGQAAKDPRRRVSISSVAKALAINKERALKIAQQLVDGGVLARDGKFYVVPAETPPQRVVAESDAAEHDAGQIREQLLGDAGLIAIEADNGTTAHLDSSAERIATDLSDYGHIARPEAPREGAAQMAARMLLEMPEDYRTDDVIQAWGFSKDEVPLVRAMLEQAQPAIVPEPIVEAMKPPESAPKMPEAAQKLAADPEAAWSEWAKDKEAFAGKTLDSTVRQAKQQVDALHRRAFSKQPPKRREALDAIVELMRTYDNASEMTALFGLHDMGKDVLSTLAQLRTQITVEGVVKPPKALRRKFKQRKEDREAEAASEKWLRENEGKKPNPESGSTILFGELYLAARDVWRYAMRLAEAGWRATWKAAYASRDWAATVALKGPAAAMRWSRAKVFGAANASKRIEGRAAAALSRNAGAGDWMGFKDQLSAWGDVDAAMAVEHSGRMGQIAVNMRDLVERELLKQDGAIDHGFNEWLRVKGMPEPPDPESDAHVEWTDLQKEATDFESKMTETQRKIADAIRESYADDLDMIGRGVHPQQVYRDRNRKVLERVISAFRRETMERQQKLLAEIEKLPAEEDVDADDLEAVAAAAKQQSRVRAMQRALKQVERAAKKAEDRLGSIDQRYYEFLQRWGIRREGYSPHIPAENVREAAQQRAAAVRAKDSGKLGALMGSQDMGALADELAKIGDRLPQDALDHISNPVPQHLKGGHMKKREGKLEAAGNRDPSALRSFFHYKHELYRMLPAIDYMRNNQERLWGELQPVSLEEMRKGRLDDGGQEVEIMTDEDWDAVQTAPRRRLGGQVYELRTVNLEGSKHVTHYRTPKARQAAIEGLASAERFAEIGGSEKDKNVRASIWTMDGERDVAAPWEPKVVLLDSRQGTADARVPRVEDLDGGAVKLPQFGAEVRWASEVLGRVVYRKGGEIARVRSAKNGAALERMLLSYHDQVMKLASGRALLTKAERWAQRLSGLVSHKLMGMMNPGSAVNELLGGVMANIGMGRMPFGDALDAGAMAMEYQGRLWAAEKQLRANPAQWLKEHSPRMVDGKHLVVPKSVVEGLQTPAAKLEKMSPAARAKAEMKNDAFRFMAESMLSGESAIDYFAMGSEPVAHGPVGKAEAVLRKGSRVAGRASWLLRRMASTHNTRATLLGSYMIERRAGKSDAEARKVATNYALAQGVVQNRATQSRFAATWFGRLLKPAYGWQSAVSATNWRYLFHKGFAGGVSRVAAMAVNLWWWQQVGYLFGMDMTRWLGTGASEIPVVGPMATYSTRKLQAIVGMAADPDSPSVSAAEPQWKQKLRGAIESVVPAAYHELVARKMRTLGLSVDPVLPPLWGTSLPWAFDAMKNSWQAAHETWNGNEPAAAQAWARAVLGQHAFVRIYDRIWGARPDPADPSFVMTRNPGTGVTVDRVKKEATWKMLLNVLTPDPMQTYDRIEKLLDGQRVAAKVGATRTRADHAQTLMRDSVRHAEEAAGAVGDSARQVLLQRSERERKQFLDAVLEEAKLRELTNRNEIVALRRQWERVARTKEHLTQAERNVLNAYDVDSGFALMTDLLNDPVERMNEKRYELVKGLWYADPPGENERLKAGLRRAKKETQDRFLAAFKQARARWEMDKEPQPAGR